MESKVFQINVVKPEGLEQFFIQLNAVREEFYLTLSDGINAWEGSVTEENLMEALGKEKEDGVKYEYHLTSETKDTVQFVWKRHILDDDIKFKLGSVQMKKLKEPGKGICELLSSSISNLKSLSSQIVSLETINKRLSAERTNALKRLEKCVQAKEEMELDLFSKFSAVLNSKKQRIQELLQELLEHEESRTIDDSPESPVASTSTNTHTSSVLKSKNIKRPNSCSDEDTGSDTDSEVAPSKRPCQSVSAKVANDSVKDNSLNLGDDSADDDSLFSLVTVARRPKRQAKNKTVTPSKPVLPRVSSGTSSDRPSITGRRRQSNTSCRSSLNRSGSLNSNKSSDNLDPDDLLNNL